MIIIVNHHLGDVASFDGLGHEINTNMVSVQKHLPNLYFMHRQRKYQFLSHCKPELKDDAFVFINDVVINGNSSDLTTLCCQKLVKLLSL